MQDPSVNDSRKKHRVCKQHWRKCKDTSRKKAESSSAVWVIQVELQRQPPYAPQKVVPEKQAVVQTKENETKDRETDEFIPISGGGQMQSSCIVHFIPSCGF